MTSYRYLLIAGLLALAPLRAVAGLELSPCRLTTAWLAGVAAECGRLTVPENPADPSGVAIGLFVARVPSLNPDPQPDPLVVIAGGPGQAATQFYLSSRAAFEAIRRERDIIVVDQRGTGRSAPLRCTAASAASLESTAAGELRRIMRACLAELDADPRFYTTSVAVIDLDTLRNALEIERWNLYGISYGTRVAQHYLRRYPQRTRSLILDGVVPSDTALGPDIALNAQRALDMAFEHCTETSDCRERFGAIALRFDALLRALETEAIVVRLPDPASGRPADFTLTADGLRSAVRLLSYTPQTAALLPLLIDAALGGDYVPIAAQSRMLTSDLESALSLPMHNAVVCTEDVPFFPVEPPAALHATYLGTSVYDALEAVCSIWPSGERDADLGAALQSDRPVLLLSGTADPITPPQYGERVAQGLTNARHLIGRGRGHGIAPSACVPALLQQFVATLSPGELDTACLDTEQSSPFFMTFSGPLP